LTGADISSAGDSIFWSLSRGDLDWSPAKLK
jgi:hypothetical protein